MVKYTLATRIIFSRRITALLCGVLACFFVLSTIATNAQDTLSGQVINPPAVISSPPPAVISSTPLYPGTFPQASAYRSRRLIRFGDSIHRAQDSVLRILDFKYLRPAGYNHTRLGLLESEGGYYTPGKSGSMSVEERISPQHYQYKTILFYLFLLVILIWGYVGYLFPTYLSNQINAILNINLARQYYEQNLMGVNMPAFMHTSALVLLLSSIVLAINYRFRIIAPENFYLLGLEWVLPSVMFLILARFILLRIIIYLVPSDGLMNFYLVHHFAYFAIGSLFILPVAAFICFNNYLPFIWLAIALGFIFTVLFILLLFRGSAITSIFWKDNLFYFFLYLCTVEFLPILLVAKFASHFTIK